MVEGYGLGIFSGGTWQNRKRKWKINLSAPPLWSDVFLRRSGCESFKVLWLVCWQPLLFPQCGQADDSADDASSAALRGRSGWFRRVLMTFAVNTVPGERSAAPEGFVQPRGAGEQLGAVTLRLGSPRVRSVWRLGEAWRAAAGRGGHLLPRVSGP